MPTPRHVVRIAAIAGLVLSLSFCGDPAAHGPPSGDPPPPGGPPPADPPPEAAFISSCTDLSCTFVDGSTDPRGTIVSRSWSFGDGATSIATNPAHTYAAAGSYAVSLTVTDNAGATGWKSENVTLTAPNPDPVLIGAGDIAGCTAGFMDRETAAIVAQHPAATVLTLGDNAYPDGSTANYNECYGRSWGGFKDRTHPSPGNHEYHTAGASGYFGYFGARAGPEGRGYYSYDLGSWHIISLNSETDVSATSAQAAWLTQDLAAHPGTCTLVYWHKPLFTSAVAHPPERKMEPLFGILYQAGADVLLSGHNHHYERFAPQQVDKTPDEGRGIRAFVVGTGGAGLYGFGTPQPNSLVRYQGWGVLKLTLRAASYTWEFLPIAGSTFTDSGTEVCH